jgi:hypothetical protein
MSDALLNNTNYKLHRRSASTEAAILVTRLRNSIWILGVPSWLFGITDRSIAALADGMFSTIEVFQLFTASLFFLSWIVLKPELSSVGNTMPAYQPELASEPPEHPLIATRFRMAELQEFHLIRQEYVLPFPYLCQIYHLLNLKHLEDIHSFSLNNLKILNVSDLRHTTIGGVLRFQTVLESSFNVLRIWRQPIVEVELILHNPYTVELSIPVYSDRRIVVLFNVFPISNNEHRFSIDIYSDLGWFRPLLQILLHTAACLTLFEDLPYLRSLAERNLHRLVNPNRVSGHATMQLFRRFADLYGSVLCGSESEPASLMGDLNEKPRLMLQQFPLG